MHYTCQRVLMYHISNEEQFTHTFKVFRHNVGLVGLQFLPCWLLLTRSSNHYWLPYTIHPSQLDKWRLYSFQVHKSSIGTSPLQYQASLIPLTGDPLDKGVVAGSYKVLTLPQLRTYPQMACDSPPSLDTRLGRAQAYPQLGSPLW